MSDQLISDNHTSQQLINVEKPTFNVEFYENAFCRDQSASPSRSYLCTIFDDAWDNAIRLLPEITAQFTSKLVPFDEINNDILAASSTKHSATFMLYSLELCPETNRYHIHLIISLNNSMRFTYLLKNVTFFKPREGFRVNFKQIFNMSGAITYCTKESSHIAGPFEWGTRPQQGARNDIHGAIDLLNEGGFTQEALRCVATQMPEVFIKFHRGLSSLCAARIPTKPQPNIQEIICVIGDPGSGKSFFAENLHPGNVYSGMYKKYDNLYFDNYRNERVLFFDEFQGSFMPFDTWKRWFQPGRATKLVTLPQRESTTQLGSDIIIFASNRLPIMWWDLDKCRANPWELFRRFTEIIYFGGEYGSQANPAWSVTFKDDERRVFLDFCVEMKANAVPAEIISKSAAKRWKTDAQSVRQIMPDDAIPSSSPINVMKLRPSPKKRKLD